MVETGFDLNFDGLSDRLSKQSGMILDSVNFLRLSLWEECRKALVLSGEVACGEQKFRRFRLKANREVVLDFWNRGFSVDESVANQFFRLVSNPGPVEMEELAHIAEVLGPLAGVVRCQLDADLKTMISIKIDSAEVKNLNGKNVLMVFWSESKQSKTHLSIFVDSNCDGLKVDEIHFSLPEKVSHELDEAIAGTLNSVQWNILAPPPIPGMFHPVI